MSPSAGTGSPASEPASNEAASARSNASTRNTQGPAPVTATRTAPSARRARKTPTMEKRDAGLGKLAVARGGGDREPHLDDQFPRLQRGLERAEEEIAGRDAATGGDDFPRPARARPTGSRRRGRCWRASRRWCPCCAPADRRSRRRDRRAPGSPPSPFPRRPPPHARVIALIVSTPASAETPTRSPRAARSTRSDGAARRCFITGIRLIPPASGRASSSDASRRSASATVPGR